MELINRFLIEAILRFTSKTPWFFEIIRNISIIITLITGLPDFLLFLTNSGINLPDFVFVFTNKTIAIASIVATIISQFTVTSAEKKQLGLVDKIYNKS